MRFLSLTQFKCYLSVFVVAMAFNLTGLDLDLFFTVNTAISIVFFFMLVLLPLVLCVVCVVALISAGSMDLKLRILLVNVFAAEISSWLYRTGLFLGYPFLFRAMSRGNIVCSIGISIYAVGGVQKFTSSALYAFNIFLFIKHGLKKVKWCALVPCIIASWLVAIVLGSATYWPQSGTESVIGFCSVNFDTILFRAIVSVVLTLDAACVGVILIFSVLTFIYVKRNTLGDNAELMKSVANLLVYFCIIAVFSLLNGLLPAVTPAIRDAAAARSGTVGMVAVEHILNVVYIFPSFATPIVAMVFLKPIRDAVKEAVKKIICLQRSDRFGQIDGDNIEMDTAL